MKFYGISLLLVLILSMAGCSSDSDGDINVDPVVFAYDTLEYRYQQITELAVDLMANISMDPTVKVKQVQDLIDEEPVVSLDFRKISTTNNDILKFVTYQQRIDEGLQDIFDQLDDAPKWQAAPLILEIKSKYALLSDSVTIAMEKFNLAAKEAKLSLAIPLDSGAAN
ncbi:MAG: hypothetical protein EOO89_23335 [Pedobacter sp.]|nr:MAG: hypothetical protein EOO89_23335 [Pedobacter sp.]